MGSRRQAREISLNILYSLEICPIEIGEAEEAIKQYHGVGKKVVSYASQLVNGTLSNLSRIDSLLEEYAQNWEIKRMVSVDRNILRQAIYELIFQVDIPPSVVINEAVELAKKYSTEDSGKFVNGILDKIKEVRSNRQEMGKDER